MKRFKIHLTGTLLAFFLFLTYGSTAHCQNRNETAAASQAEISLLTCGPRPNVYSLYGHTAIRYRDPSQGIDIAVNYGIFSFDKPFFILRFVFGLTDYEMGIEYFDDFVSHYSHTGCGIYQQVLNLTDKEKETIAAAIRTNYEPQNRTYRYNYFYDNCTTRARDIITRNIDGDVRYADDNKPEYPSFRNLIHGYNETHRWARFGNDMLLGVKADRPTSYAQQQFLPEILSRDLNTAYVATTGGTQRKLVKDAFWVVPHTKGVGADDFPLSPSAAMGIVAAIIVVLTIVEWRKKANFWAIDLVTMSVTGLCGLILLAMVFSEHPTVSLNLQILLLNPVTLVMMPHTIKRLRKRQSALWIKIWAMLIVAFLIGGFFQSYAEGIVFVALSLLFRNTSRIHTIDK